VKRRALVELVRSLVTASAGLRERPKEFWPLIASKLNYTETVVAKSWPQLRYSGSMAGDVLDVMTEEDRWVAKEKNRPPRSREQLAKLIDGSLIEEATRRVTK
jgi:NitT/TauT family transport system substrate-binding protein